MKVLLTVWITVCLIQEVIPSTLVRLPRHLSKQPSLVRTEYEAKYEQTGKHGNESSSVVSGKQEIVHNNCAENWNEFAEKCASLIKDLVASLAGAVSSKPGDATNLQLQIKNTFKHFDSTHNCTCLNHTGKKLSDLDLSPLFSNISISTVRPNTNDCNPPCTEANNTEGKALEVDPTKVLKLQKEKNRALIDAEHLNVNSENADGLKDQSTNNYRRQAQAPQALEKKPQKLEKLGDSDLFSEDSTHSTSTLKDKPAERIENGPIDSQISKPAIKFPEDRDYEPQSSRLPTALRTGSGALKSIPDNSVRNNQTLDILLGKYSPSKSEYEKPIQEPLKSVQPTTPKGHDLEETLDQPSTKPILLAKVPKHTKTSEKKPFLVFPVINSNSNLPESSPPENHAETVTSSSIVEPIPTDPSLSLLPKAIVTHKNPTVLSQHESALPELEYGQPSTIQETTTCTPMTNNDQKTEDDLHHTMSFVNPVTKILEGANQQSKDITLGKDTVQETAPTTTNAQIPEVRATISEANAHPITSVSTTCSPTIETSAISGSTAGLIGIVHTTIAPNTAYSPTTSKTSAAQTVIASTINAQPIVSSASTSEIPAAQTMFVSTTCAPTKETPFTSESTAGPTGVVYTTTAPNTAHSSTTAETSAASGTVSLATTSETSAAPGATPSVIASSATTSETSAAPGAASSAIASSAIASETSATPGASFSPIASSATTSETSAVPGATSSAIASSTITSESSAAPGATFSEIASSATTSEACETPGAASSAIASWVTTSPATTSEVFGVPSPASSAVASSATTSETSAAPGAASSAIASSAITSETSAAPGATFSEIASSATTSEACETPGAASSAIASWVTTSPATTSEVFGVPSPASSAVASSATTSETSAAPGAASSAIASSAITSETSVAPGATSSAIASSAITSETSAAPGTVTSATGSSATTDSTFSTKPSSLVPEYIGTTLKKQTKTPENNQYSSTKVTTPVFIYPLKSSTVVPTVDSQINPQSVVTEDSNGKDSLVTEVHSSSSTLVDLQKNTETTPPSVYPLYLQTDSVNIETPRTSFTESPSETTAEIKPAGPGLLVPKNENLSPQEEGQVPVLTQPTTFQTTSADPTPSQTLSPQQTESTKFLIPTTLAPRDFDGTIPIKPTSPKFGEVNEDDDDDEDCCSCESCTDEEITDPKQFKENACRDLEEARRELKAIFDKIKKKLKCGRKTPQSITAS